MRSRARDCRPNFASTFLQPARRSQQFSSCLVGQSPSLRTSLARRSRHASTYRRRASNRPPKIRASSTKSARHQTIAAAAAAATATKKKVRCARHEVCERRHKDRHCRHRPHHRLHLQRIAPAEDFKNRFFFASFCVKNFCYRSFICV